MKFKVVRDNSFDKPTYWLYARKFFYWVPIEVFNASTRDEAIKKAGDLAYNHKYPTVEFEL